MIAFFCECSISAVREKEKTMAKRRAAGILPEGRWMTECDVIRYNLGIPQKLKEQVKKEALERGMNTSTYICRLLTGDIKREKAGKQG
jgi:hypothetical protein